VGESCKLFLLGWGRPIGALTFKVRVVCLPLPSHQLCAHGQVSALIRCIAAWMRWCDSESLSQTTLNRDFLPPYATEITSPNRICLLRPESRAPLLLILLATTCSLKNCPVLSLPFIVTTRRSLFRASCFSIHAGKKSPAPPG
jgi:hypothetical protein